MRWLLLLVLLSGCAGTKVTLTRVNGEPSLSVEYKGDGRERLQDCSPVYTPHPW